MRELVHQFITAACVPLDSGHASGTLDDAEAILAVNPGIAGCDIHTAAVLGDDETVRRFIAQDRGNAVAKGGPHSWDALTHLCFSRYLRLDASRSEGFVRSAEALLKAGANANSGFYSEEHRPNPEFESVLYGAAGVAHHSGVTRLLLEHGADPNNGEVTYHSPETNDNTALKLLVGSGKLNADSLATMLLRKADWHDFEGINFLLDHDADPNRLTHWGFTGLHQALRRDNDLANVEAMLDHGADPSITTRLDHRPAWEIAARRGRGDVLELLEKRGRGIQSQGVPRLIAACARADVVAIHTMAEREVGMVDQIKNEGGTLLAEFAGNGNTNGVRALLDLGADVRALYHQGDGYFGIAKDSTALHVAAWRARPGTVKLLIERGAPVGQRDAAGRTALALAVRACVDSYWQYRRFPFFVEALLKAGASVEGIKFPCSYPAVDELLRAHGARAIG
jgi:ankyrin repeat protein